MSSGRLFHRFGYKRNVNSELLLLVQYCFTALVPRICNGDKIENTTFTPNKVINAFGAVLFYWTSAKNI